MKRWSTSALLVATFVTLAVALSACGSDPSPLVLGKDSTGGSAELKRGQILEVKLEGNPTTGYSWEVKKSGEPVVRLQNQPVYTQSNAGGSTLVGSGGTYTFTFVGAETGATTIELVYHRPWETTTAPLETYFLEATVN